MMTGKKEAGGWSNLHLLILALLLALASCVFHIKNARAGHPVFRDQHLGTALGYYKGHIDLLRPVIVGFNANGTPTPLEFPVWQGLAALTFKVMGPWHGWANVVSLLIFFTCLFPLFCLTKIFVGEHCAWWTLVFFLAQPLVFIYAGNASPDGLSIAAAIWFLYCGVKLVRNPGVVWWVLACAAGALAAVSKLPFFMAAGMVCFFLLATRHKNSVRAWVALSAVGLVVVAVFFSWTHYSNKCLAQAELPLMDLRVSNSESSFWYFGDLHYRLMPGNWLKGGWRILNSCFGSFALVGLFLYAFFFIKETVFAKWILLAGFVTTLVFTHLVLHHSHYYLMFTPAFAILCAQAAGEGEKRLALAPQWQVNLMWLVVAIVLGLSVVQGLMGMKVVLDFDPYPYDMAKIIQKYSTPSEKILMEGGGWGGKEFILSDRQGLSIWDTKMLENPETLNRLKTLGYTKLIMVSESPLLTALQQINPGQSKQPRVTYRDFLTPVVKNWPTEYESDDILIKDIP
jgi:hypothetical protein